MFVSSTPRTKLRLASSIGARKHAIKLSPAQADAAMHPNDDRRAFIHLRLYLLFLIFAGWDS